MEREDYFFGIEESSGDLVYALVIYDIVANKRRIKLSKFLQGYGHRIQKSGFEVKLTRSKFNKLVSEIGEFCGDEDSIRIYKISSRSEVIHWGVDDSFLQDDVIVV